jgi:hypothetical protein
MDNADTFIAVVKKYFFTMQSSKVKKLSGNIMITPTRKSEILRFMARNFTWKIKRELLYRIMTAIQFSIIIKHPALNLKSVENAIVGVSSNSADKFILYS